MTTQTPTKQDSEPRDVVIKRAINRAFNLGQLCRVDESRFFTAQLPELVDATVAALQEPIEAETRELSDMPPLPEPNSYCQYKDSHEYDVFNAEQMHEYARAAIAADRALNSKSD